MDSPEDKYQPRKLRLEMVAAALGYSGRSLATQYDAVLQRQRDDGLILKTDVALNCFAQKMSDGLDENFDANGNLQLLSCGASIRIVASGGEVTLGPAVLTEESVVTCLSFTFEEESYYPLDDTQMHPQSLHYKIREVYVDRVDLKNAMKRGFTEHPPYADRTSDHYAPELVLAMELHRELRIAGKGNLNLNLEDRIHAWLKTNRPDIKPSDTRLKRLRAIIGTGKKI
ncbi:MAG: hypothetical protein ACJAW7_001112 [Candidatus Azotimanducaceae bacterium]|jgi:hypothetical protein